MESALEDLANGRRADHVEGVDDVVAELDAETLAKSELLTALSDAGWGDHVARILSVNEGECTSRPVDIVPHHEGLPDFDVCLAPKSASLNGNYGVFISKMGVFAASIGDPPVKHHWRILSSAPYDGMDDLVRIVEQFNESAFD